MVISGSLVFLRFFAGDEEMYAARAFDQGVGVKHIGGHFLTGR